MEGLRQRDRMGKAAAHAKAIGALAAVQIRDHRAGDGRLAAHELSGGMGQRVMIAMVTGIPNPTTF